MTRRRLPFVAFLSINAVVSVVTTLIVLFVWDSNREPQTLVLPTFSGVSAVSGAPPGPEAANPEQTSGEEQPSTESDNGAETDDGAVAVLPATDTPNPDFVIHVVQGGEVMGAIAELYDVPVEDILIANELDNPNLLDLGQELIIPIGGLPPTPVPTATEPVPTSPPELEPIATVTPLPVGTISVVIQDVLFPGDVTREAIVIFNAGSVLDMEGWVLSDEQGNEFEFPSFRLFGNGTSVTVYSGVGEASASELYWGLSTPVWGEDSDTAILQDPTGSVQNEFPIEQ